MTRRDTPQSERRQALDAAIAALDEKRRELSGKVTYAKDGFEFGIRAQKRTDELNKYIAALTAMKNEGPLL